MKDNQQKSVPTGYGPNNPEPIELKDSSKPRKNELHKNALHAAEEYINHKH